MHRGHHFKFLQAMSNGSHFSRCLKQGSSQSKCFSTFGPEERGPPESLTKDARRFGQYLKSRGTIDSKEIPQGLKPSDLNLPVTKLCSEPWWCSGAWGLRHLLISNSPFLVS